MFHPLALGMLDSHAEYLFYVPGLAAAIRFQFCQKDARGLRHVQQDFRPGNRFGNRPVEHLAVVPDAERILQSGEPLELRLHLLVAEIVKKLGPVAQIFGRDAKRMKIVAYTGLLGAAASGLPLGPRSLQRSRRVAAS